MRVVLLYLHVAKSGYAGAPPPEYYLPASKRFVGTLNRFDPGAPFDLHVCFCGQKPTPQEESLYDDWEAQPHVYPGAGSDIGACQFAMKTISADLCVCMSTPVYFHCDGWLKRLVEAREKHGNGLYGPMASYDVKPHIRTSCWAVDPIYFTNHYTNLIDSREKACWFEHADHGNAGDWQISNWYARRGLPVKMVTWEGEYDRADWRKPEGIFRRGDQSNCLVRDQHWDKYAAAHYHERLAFERQADGIKP